ncbi:hypothetical protein [Streptomyces sp. NPDC047014]|uniref:hypothetical protein n=1 Tax=Streptomyces sp. NPDC047014 TaxID=3155736 RepID=UPI00340B4803
MDSSSGLQATGDTDSPSADWQGVIGDYRQGDVVGAKRVAVQVGDDDTQWVETPDGVAIIPQTCDLVLTDRTMAQVVPIVILDANAAKSSSKGQRPNYVPLPNLSPQHFADLTYIATVPKSFLVKHAKAAGVSSMDDIRKFGQRVGRRYSRFAFPDNVVPWLRPLQSLAESKVDKGESPIGWAMAKVASMRLECDDEWEVEPYSLTLCIVMEPGVLPPVPTDVLPECPETLHGWLYQGDGITLQKKPAEIAERLKSGAQSLDAASRYWLWSGFAEALAGLCVPRPDSKPGVMGAVMEGRIESDIISTEDFSFERMRHSEEIDLDHLSSPLPI